MQMVKEIQAKHREGHVRGNQYLLCEMYVQFGVWRGYEIGYSHKQCELSGASVSAEAILDRHGRDFLLCCLALMVHAWSLM